MIELLRKLFSSLGLPEVIVSDNATTFTRAEFAEFQNEVCHIRSPPYHPASNGLAERAVQRGLKVQDWNTRLSVVDSGRSYTWYCLMPSVIPKKHRIVT